MLLASTIMIFRAQRDSVTASNQKQTNQSLGVAEAGIARVLNILPQYPTLATYNFADWKNANADTPAVPGLVSCNNPTGGSTVDNFADTTANWTNLDPSDISKGQYKVLDYQYSDPRNHLTPGTGTLTVAGRLRNGTLSLALTGERGFYACIGANQRTVTLTIHGKTNNPTSPFYEIKTQAFARS